MLMPVEQGCFTPTSYGSITLNTTLSFQSQQDRSTVWLDMIHSVIDLRWVPLSITYVHVAPAVVHSSTLLGPSLPAAVPILQSKLSLHIPCLWTISVHPLILPGCNQNGRWWSQITIYFMNLDTATWRH